MQGLHWGKVGSDGAPAAALLTAAALAFAAVTGACGTAIPTPLPDIKPVSSTSLSQEDRTKAVEELNKKRATHEHDAEQEIEQSR
jgi:hypothetical protein